jgi:hypothetical protein
MKHEGPRSVSNRVCFDSVPPQPRTTSGDLSSTAGSKQSALTGDCGLCDVCGQVSYEPPEGRLHFLDVAEHGWSVQTTLDEEHGNYLYVCRRPGTVGGGGGWSEAGGGGAEEGALVGACVDLDELD